METCECTGINLLRDMVDVYRMWHSETCPDVIAAARKARIIMPQLQKHLTEQVNQPGNEQVKANLQPTLDSLQYQLTDLQHNRAERPFILLDHYRDRLHKSEELKYLLLCKSPPRQGESRLEEVEILSMVFTMLDGKDPNGNPLPQGTSFDQIYGNAKDPLDALAQLMDCIPE